MQRSKITKPTTPPAEVIVKCGAPFCDKEFPTGQQYGYDGGQYFCSAECYYDRYGAFYVGHEHERPLPRPANCYGEEYTWFYANYSDTRRLYLVCFQWLTFQGSEFSMVYTTEGKRNQAFFALLNHFAPGYQLRTSSFPYSAHQGPNKDVDLKERTLYPDDIVPFLVNGYLELTPRWFKSRSILYRYNYLLDDRATPVAIPVTAKAQC